VGEARFADRVESPGGGRAVGAAQAPATWRAGCAASWLVGYGARGASRTALSARRGTGRAALLRGLGAVTGSRGLLGAAQQQCPVGFAVMQHCETRQPGCNTDRKALHVAKHTLDLYTRHTLLLTAPNCTSGRKSSWLYTHDQYATNLDMRIMHIVCMSVRKVNRSCDR